MDAQELKNLQEAYLEVYEEIDVKLKTPEERAKYIEDAKKREERKNQPSIFDIARKRREEGRPLKLDLSRMVDAQNKKEREKRLNKNVNKEEVEVYQVDEAEKWIQKAIKKPGALSKQLGVPEDENIPAGKLAAAAKKGGKLGKRARLAMTLKGLRREEIDLYDIVFTHLIEEGYAETEEAAAAIMVNMSEEWRNNIIEGK